MKPGGAARILHLSVGVVCLALGILGAFLPVLPSTPLLLVSLWAFSRSSRRLEAWLLAHRGFGPRLRAFRDHRVVPLPVKLTAWTTMIVSLSIMVVGRTPWPVLLVTAALMVWGALYIGRLPSRPETGPEPDLRAAREVNDCEWLEKMPASVSIAPPGDRRVREGPGRRRSCSHDQET